MLRSLLNYGSGGFKADLDYAGVLSADSQAVAGQMEQNLLY